MTGKHRQSEVTLRQPDRLMTSPSQAPPTGMRLQRRVVVSEWCHPVSRYQVHMYAAGSGGVDRVTSDGQASRVISVDGIVQSISVNDGVIYKLVYRSSDRWSVRVYSSDYWLVS